MADKSNQNLQSLLNILRNNFSTFLLGLTVLLVLILVISLSFTSSQKTSQKPGKNWVANISQIFTGKPKSTPSAKASVKTYQVKEGDDLWHIAEATYGSGYNAYDIAKANKIPDPNLIERGQKLILPNVKPKTPTKGIAAGVMTGKAASRPVQYTVQSGDYLWKIAQTYYGDGYAWIKIAQANNLAHPDLIFVGNILTLP